MALTASSLDLTKSWTKSTVDPMEKGVSVHEAKTHLSRLLARVASGETIVIARAGKPIARLVPITAASTPRRPGNEDVKLASDFDQLPRSIRRAFGSK